LDKIQRKNTEWQNKVCKGEVTVKGDYKSAGYYSMAVADYVCDSYGSISNNSSMRVE